MKIHMIYISKIFIFGKAPKIVNIDQLLVLKKYILFFAIVLLTAGVKAQSGYNYQEWGVGVGTFYERGYTNITHQDNHFGLNANFIYNYNPFLPVEFEIQKGTLSGGGLGPNNTINPTLDPFGRVYTNNYVAAVVHADFQYGAGIDYSDSWFLNIVKNFYSGIGLGLISNSNKVQRTSVVEPSYIFPGVNSSIDFMVPIRIGYDFKIFDDYNEPSMAINVGYVHTIAFGEGLDGYDDPSQKFKNNALDQYRQIAITFKYYFGRVVSYNKLIRNFN
jgi:hypothetical protein